MVTDVTKAALQVRNLVKSYRGVKAVRGISFTAQFGEITAVLGPNSAGKTTTIECCEGLREPDAGTIKILDQNPRTASTKTREDIGVMLQDGGLPMAVPAGVVLRHVGRLYRDDHAKREKELVERLQLQNHLKTPVRRLSGGNQQRLALACALLGDPRILFLDEPTAGMDPHARVAVHNLIAETKAAGTAIILTTHLLDEAESLADQIILMAGGEIQARGSMDQITDGDREGIEITLTKSMATGDLQAGLPGRFRVVPAERRNRENLLTESNAWEIIPAPDGHEFAALAGHLANLGVELKGLRPLTDLTSLFLQLAENGESENS